MNTIAQYLKRTASDTLAAVSGAADDSPGTLIARLRRVIHDREGSSLLDRIQREWAALVNAGKAKAERLEEPEVRTATDSLLEDLGTEVPDQRRLDCLRRAFLGIAIGDPVDHGGSMGLAFLATARSLNGQQVQVLGAAARTPAPITPNHFHTHGKWLDAMEKSAGIPFRPLLLRELGSLGDRLLINVGVDAGNRGSPGSFGEDGLILTDYGRAFCKFLDRSETTEHAPK